MWAHSFIPLYIQGEKSVPTLFVPYIQEEKSMPTQRKTKSVVLARSVHKLLHSHYHCQDLNFHSLCLSKVSFSQPSWSHRHLENGSVVQLVIACVCPTIAFDFRSSSTPPPPQPPPPPPPPPKHTHKITCLSLGHGRSSFSSLVLVVTG